MSKHYQVGETVVSTYAFGRTLKESSAYLWLEATNSQNAVPAIVQVLNPKAVWKETEIREVIDYFDQLLRLHRSGLWVPEYLLADRNCPVALIYKPASAKPLIDAIKQSPQKELTLLSEAVAALHSLHNRDILHGGLSPECFVQTEDKVKLYGFGYAPLLRCGNSAAKHDCEEFLAPEVAGRTEISIASDLYAFAKAIGSWKPELENSVWYQKATDEDPVNRFQRARKMFDALERVLGEEETEEAPLEKFKLSSRTEPPDAGSVLGVGNYQNGGEALLEAKPISSYKFVRWEGDKRGKDNPLRFKIEGNLSVTAVFEKKGADATLVLKHAVEISCVPVDAGAVFGGGNHMHGKEISVKAVAHRLYQFQAWNGDLSGIENPLRLEVDGPMQIKAQFV
jgi:serine/threonine protein kinase